MKEENFFQDFSGLYSLNKTLRFELKPVWNTKNNLINDWIIDTDREVEQNYKRIKPYFDELHKRFIKESLTDVYLSWLENYYNIFVDFNKDLESRRDRKKRVDLEKASTNLRNKLVSFFKEKWDEWKKEYKFLKKWWINVLDEKEVLELMEVFFPEEKDLFKSFNNFFTYFSNFKESRKNLYASNWITWAVATRAIEENLAIFIKNKLEFEKFKENFPDFVSNEFTKEEKSIFDLDYYNNCLLQEWINKYAEILWGRLEDNGNKIQWINEKIILFKQDKNKANKQDAKFPRFKFLHKQILSDKERSFTIDEIKDSEELFKLIEWNKKQNLENVDKSKKIIDDFLLNNDNYNINWVFLKKQSLNTISSKYFVSWDYIWFYLKNLEKLDFISFGQLKEAFEKIEEKDLKNIFKEKYVKDQIVLENKDIYKNFLTIFYFELNKEYEAIAWYSKDIEKLSKEEFKKSDEEVEIIKNYLDSILSFSKMMKYFILEKWRNKIENLDTDNSFYNVLDDINDDFQIWKEYNLVRNFITKKQIKTEKFKLNFNNSQFLEWWDKDKETERLWTIFRKDNLFYLWILKNKKLFENHKWAENNEAVYEKMNYKQLNNIFRQLPRLLFPLQKKLDNLEWAELDVYLSKYREEFWYNEEIAQIKAEFDIFQKNKEKWDKFDEKKLFKLISYYKNWLLVRYSEIYDLEEIKNNDYYDLADFYSNVEKKTYSLDFIKIEESFIDNAISNWDLYLFQIYNKDFSEYKKKGSKENIHTTLFKLLFDERNLEKLVIKLSGWAEMFFRDKTENLKIKKDKSGKEVIEHRRYSEDKMFFHLPIVINANSWDFYKVNQMVNEYLVKTKEKYVLWIDRWENNLVYYSVIDSKWNIIETASLNEIERKNLDEDSKDNYLEKLEIIEQKRKEARVSWGTIENIKELKNWYISQVVNKLSELIIKYNAIIVFEDLNSWFKIWRQKIEKQIYQKLELALAKKLNYLTYKDREVGKLWWMLKWIQLTWKVNTYDDIKTYKQFWIMFFVNPAHTSKTCPSCWFRKNIIISNSDTKEKQKKFFNDIKIDFDGEKFKFSYMSNNKKDFQIFSNVERLRFNNKTRNIEKIDINKGLKKLFEWIDLKWDLNKQIEDKNAEFYKSLTFLFNMILNLRSSDWAKNIDYISCPSCWFHSDNWFQWKEFNWDANWAYNIAKKWLIVLERIIKNPEKPDLFIKDIDWDEFNER